LPLLVQSSLGIYSPLRRQTLKHNVVDRDRILIPPQWDSWGKIKVIREGFDVEGISKGFSGAIQDSRSKVEKVTANGTVETDPKTGSRKPPNVHDDDDEWKEVLSAYEETIRNPKYQAPDTNEIQGDKTVEVSSLSMQDFLAKQAEFLEKLRAEEEKNQEANASTNGSRNDTADDGDKDSRINRHIGPVQFNMGGIQVDADDMLRTLRQQDREETPVRDTGAPAATSTPDGKQNEQLASFFAGLIKKGGRDNSPKPTPK
jgi:dynein light intermediate chain 1